MNNLSFNGYYVSTSTYDVSFIYYYIDPLDTVRDTIESYLESLFITID